MTVKELIATLSTCHPDSPVIIVQREALTEALLVSEMPVVPKKQRFKFKNWTKKTSSEAVTGVLIH